MALLLSLLISFLIAFALSIELLNVNLNEKNISATHQYDTLFYTIERKMQQWIMQPQYYSACLVPESDPNNYPEQLVHKTISGCFQENNAILLHFIVEDLNIIPCFAIGNNSAHFYRMTTYGEAQSGQTLIMQMVYAIPEINIIQTCVNGNIKTIAQGRQSWRVLWEGN